VTLRLAAPAIVLASLLLLPFLDRPFTIDDPLFLRAAQHALLDPLHPGDFEQVWNAGDRRMLSQYWLGGTLPAYLLVPVAALGSREWVAHLYQWLFLCAFLMGSVSVARRMGCDKRQANIVGLLVGSNPVTLAMSATVMPDVMAAAFAVWGVDRALAFREEQRIGAGVAAGVLLAVAVLCRGNAAVVLIVVALLLLPSEWKRVVACWWPVVLAIALAGTWLALQHSPATALGALTAARNIPRNLIGFLAFQALTGPLLLYSLLSVGWRWVAAVAGIIATGIVLSLVPSANLSTYAIPAALGICFIAACVLIVRDLRYAAPLVVWLCAGLVALTYVYMSAKYLLPGVPAAALLIVLHGARVRQPRYPLVIALLIAISWIAGAAIILGDTALADSQRRVVQERIAPAVRRGRTVWAGGQWAFLEYAQRAGAKALANTPPLPQPGDTIVISRLDYYGRLDQLPFQRDLVSTTSDWRCGIFVLNRHLSAGFYSNRFGYLPFAIGCGEVNRYDTYIVPLTQPRP
jgi:4-amino-4-deoxy-L-arabinose transferase-like glycosyltransferase